MYVQRNTEERSWLLQWKSNKYFIYLVCEVIQMNQLDATMIY